MATYNKRGYKKPKEKEVKDEMDQVIIDAKDSETAEVFNTLDDNANKIGAWFTENSKKIILAVSVIALAVVGYLAYQHWIVEPKQEEGANEMFTAQQYYNQAVNASGQEAEALYTKALKGADGKYGFLDIIENYGGTDAENLSRYYAGTSYLNLNQYKEAIEQLEKFHSNDLIMKAMSLGAIGDAFSQLKQYDEALEYYQKAADHKENNFTTPKFAFKAGLVALKLNNKEQALKNFTLIKDKYPASIESMNIDQYIGLAQ